MSAFIKGGNGQIKARPSKKREVMVGRRKVAGSNINAFTAIRMYDN